MVQRLRIITLFLIMCVGSTSAFDLGALLGDMVSKERVVGLLLSDIEQRKKQLKDLEEERAALRERAGEAIRTATNTSNEIKKQIDDTKTQMRVASGSYEELLKKKISVLTERRQNLANYKDLWNEVDGKIMRHKKLIEEIIEVLTSEAGSKEGRLIYSWKDLDETKGKIDQLAGKIVTQKVQKEQLKKLKVAEKEEIASLKADIESKAAEKGTIAKELEGPGKEEGSAFIAELKVKAEINELEVALLKEKIAVSEIKIEGFAREERYTDSRIFLLKHKLKTHSDELLRIQKKLVIDISDVERAKGELEKAKKRAAFQVTRIARDKDRLKVRRDVLSNSIKTLEKQVEEIKKAGELKTVKGYLVESRLLLVKNEKLVVDKELDVNETNKERLDINIKLKELKAQIIEVLHLLRVSREKIDDWLSEFRTKLRAAENAKKVLKDKRDATTNFISAISKEREELIEKQKEIVQQRDKLFSGAGNQYVETLANIKRAIEMLGSQKAVVERHSSQISEFLVRQDDVINQYSFIVKYLESQKTEGLWKRADRAISLEQVVQALVDSENFFKGLFWDTPSYLSPVSLFHTVRAFKIDDFVGLGFFFLLFLLLFIVTKLLLLFGQRQVKSWQRYTGTKVSYAIMTGIEHLMGFVLDHFKLIFTWLFVLVHVALRTAYFKPLASAYGVTVFYLVSIPALMYLSHKFVMRLRVLNERLQYLFIAQASQWKVTLLVEIFLYATAIILPLRKAFWGYFGQAVAFSEVTLAAYTLIVVVIILFFFNKDDVLRLLGGTNPIVVWLRKRVERYYYPVFIFCMFLLVLATPYVGYSNLAWFLVFAIPTTMFLIYGLFLLHYIVRRYSLFFFIKEEEDEVINKFEHAKAYYGLFVVLTFILLALGALVLIARLWGMEGYTLGQLWKSLSEEWVLKMGDDKLGFVEAGKLGLFITSGLVISSLIKRFVLGKLFEIFRTESGVQNTISQILHYFIIILAVILGFTAINLSQYALTVGGLLLVGVSFGLRDQIADYFAGILVLIERPLEIGHYVQAGEFEGKVHRISARSTTLKTARNFFITIPNRDIVAKPIVNWGQGRYAVGCELKIMVSFDSDPELVQKVLLDVLKAHSKVLRVPAPLVRFEGFEASALYFYCRCYISARKVLDMWDLQSDLRFSVVRAFRDNNVVIPYPQTVLHFAKGCDRMHPGPKEGAINPIEIKFDDKS